MKKKSKIIKKKNRIVNKKSIILIVAILVIVILGIVFVSRDLENIKKIGDVKIFEEKVELEDESLLLIEKECEFLSSSWLSEFNECEYVSEDWCEKNGGEFNECGSACRNEESEEEVVCALNCVPLCKFTERDVVFGSDPLNTSYIINNNEITLLNGQFRRTDTAENWSINLKFEVVDANTEVDMNNDGKKDYIVVLSRETEGSGKFFYLALALKSGSGYLGTIAAPITADITIQNTEVRNGEIVVNYLARRPWENFSHEPSVAKSRHFIWEDSRIQNKENEIMLDEKEAESLAFDQWGSCGNNCETSIMDGIDNVWYVAHIFQGLKDDSIATQLKVTQVNYINGEWVLGEKFEDQFECQKGRGHRDFSSELCL